MSIDLVVDLVTETLKAGMTTALSEDEDYYVKTWNKSLHPRHLLGDLPMAVLDVAGSEYRPFAVGEDVEVVKIQITFYSDANNIYCEKFSAPTMATEAAKLLRKDPTLGGNVIDTKLEISLPSVQRPLEDGNFVRTAKLSCKVWINEMV